MAGLHIGAATGVIRRLLDAGAERFLLASALLGATAQCLVRRLCPACKEAGAPDETELCWLSGAGVTSAPAQVWRAKGCKECRNLGYRGCLTVYEVLVMDQELRDMLARGADLREIETVAAAKLRPMVQTAAPYVLSGETTVQEAAQATALLSQGP